MKINSTFLFILMVMSASATMAQKTLSVVNVEIPVATSSETTKNSIADEVLSESETLQISENVINTSDKSLQSKLQENKNRSEKARAERIKITEALRKRIKRNNQVKASSKARFSEKKSKQN